MSAYETVIGLEVHVHLCTKSKLFCSCPTTFGVEPNTNVCEVCAGMPGVLPVLNQTAVEYATRAGLALDCTINNDSVFARKNYFYPDMPYNYQISQFERPLCEFGHLDINVGGETKRIGITRIHMETDAGKNIHEGDHSYLDLNRAAVPLIEIVSEPDMRSAEEAVAYLKALHAIVVYLGITDGNMEEGSFRCDANVSIRPKGAAEFGTRAELKNLNSFRHVQKAIEYEVSRQQDVLEDGDKVIQETRLFDSVKGVTMSMRDKEEAHDYRYFPDPDLVPVHITDEQLETVCKACGLDKFVHSLPQGFDTVLSESTTISAGQKQLLTIARAILADNPILILDEATSSVDTRTEIQIQKAMNNLMKGRTSFVIAHRLSTIRDADVILVMKNGEIAEQGTHEELLAKGGFYAQRYKSPFEKTA